MTSKPPETEVERPSSGDDEDPDEPGEGGDGYKIKAKGKVKAKATASSSGATASSEPASGSTAKTKGTRKADDEQPSEAEKEKLNKQLREIYNTEETEFKLECARIGIHKKRLERKYWLLQMLRK